MNWIAVQRVNVDHGTIAVIGNAVEFCVEVRVSCEV